MPPTISHLLLALLPALAISFVSYRLRALTLSGALAATIVGAIVFGLGGWSAAGALIAFFVTGSVLSRWRKGVKDALGFEKSGRRDAWQVLANGGLAAVWLVLQHVGPVLSETRALVYALVAIAAAAADTWATEIGAVMGGRPYNVVTRRPVEPGESGAISLMGTMAALGGATLVAVFAMPLGVKAVVVVAVSGFAGALIDSVLGATVQAQWRDPDRAGRWTERGAGRPDRGWRGVNNDVVNAASILIASMIGALLSGALGLR
jgi:uncharacterized protein (TIGR00297 family)